MAFESFDYSVSMDVTLRDTSGGESIYGNHRMRVIHITGITGSYETGGVIVPPDLFGLTRVEFMSLHSNLVINIGDEENINMVKVCDFGLNSEDDGEGGVRWRWIVFTWDGSSYNELGDGVEFELFPGMTITWFVIGLA